MAILKPQSDFLAILHYDFVCIFPGMYMCVCEIQELLLSSRSSFTLFIFSEMWNLTTFRYMFISWFLILKVIYCL
jgi:hypothetical protein